MKDTRLIMDMPITVEIPESPEGIDALDEVFAYFHAVDDRFSTFKDTSEITMINRGILPVSNASADMQNILDLCEQTKQETDGYFDIERNGRLDPSGLVKGWAIRNAAELLRRRGVSDYYVDAGGDIQTSGLNTEGRPWTIGIRNPFRRTEIVKVISVSGKGVATSGTAVRGQHIYNPLNPEAPITDIVSLTVIGPDVYEADRFATAAFAMGKSGIRFLASHREFSGYMIDSTGIATYTPDFESYVVSN